MVIDWLQAGELPGIAVSGCRLPAPGGFRRVLGTALDADLVAFTPRACLVIDIEMPAEPMTGDMQCPAAEPWRMAGISGDPIEVRLRDTNPLDRLTETIEAVGAVLGEEDSPVEVLGLLVVVPFAGVPITMNLDREGLPAGTDVLLAEDPHQLYERLAAVDQVRAVAWTAERVRGALDVLVGEQHGLSGEQLVGLGFPAVGGAQIAGTVAAPSDPVQGAGAAGGATGVPGTSVPGAVPDPAPTPTAAAAVPPPATAAVPPSATGAVPPTAGSAPVPESSAPEAAAPLPGATPDQPSPGANLHSVARKRGPLTSLLLAILALIAFGTALWLFSRCAAADDAAPVERTPLPVLTVADRPDPIPAPPPARQTATCYPFQSDC
ncbi:hypothetical protein [Nocardia jiangsuensis]|uniref:Uncharacterized protein n=1 Tax=Nocardia jiangsuensis TaxID=1691563 RepID=A0ABV8DS35_9NOCA